MRPTPDEVIGGVRRILRDVIEPELSTDYARDRLREIRAVLAQVDWNDHHSATVRDNAELVAVFERSAEWIDDRVREGLVDAEVWRSILNSDALGAESEHQQLSTRNAELAGFSTVLIELVSQHLRSDPEDARAKSLDRALWDHFLVDTDVR